MVNSTEVVELGFGALFKQSTEQFWKNKRLILLFLVVIGLPISVLIEFLNMISPDSASGISSLSNVLSATIGLLMTIGIVLAVKNSLEGKSQSFGETLKDANSKWSKVLVTSLVSGLLLLLLTLLFIIPGIIFGIYWLLATYVVIQYGISDMKALSYSKKLVENKWWKTFGYAILMGILILVVVFVLGMILGLLDGLVMMSFNAVPLIGDLSKFFNSVILDTVIDISSAFYAVFAYVYFRNLDAIKKAQGLMSVSSAPTNVGGIVPEQPEL